ncbi:MAG TPA: ABC transporter ATP-binding protein, partial [Kiritimatiellia bacterium]|nr:ABC transporter ATP-binding protein [Kiritimatiellia bacterium]
YAIETVSLVKRYGARRALDGLSLAVPRYAVLGLVGPNGAGKTTWMMSVAGLLHLHGGTVNLLGGGPFDPAVHSGRVTLLPQDSELPLESRPVDLLTHYGLLQGLTRREAERSAASMLQEVHLGDRLAATVRSLSHGMRKRVMIAQCFIGFPELVLLDEPLSGLDPRETAHMRAFLTRRRGCQTLVISSHNLHDIEIMCDRVAFIEKGLTVRNATLDEIIGTSNMLLYRVTTEPDDLTPLCAAVPHATFAFDAANGLLCCRYDPQRDTPEQINARVLPPLLAQCGVIDVSRGDSLEAAYLRTAGDIQKI